MTPDPYRSAYEKALADLSFIAERHEWLNTRKRHVENLISALQPVVSDIQPGFDDSTETAASYPEETSVEAEEATSEATENYSFLDVPAPLPESDGDPFERRVKASFRFKGLSAQRSF
ncbi:MAG: hypothetical protein WBQ95_13765 [Terracidiphilus sp.]